MRIYSVGLQKNTEDKAEEEEEDDDIVLSNDGLSMDNHSAGKSDFK